MAGQAPARRESRPVSDGLRPGDYQADMADAHTVQKGIYESAAAAKAAAHRHAVDTAPLAARGHHAVTPPGPVTHAACPLTARSPSPRAPHGRSQLYGNLASTASASLLASPTTRKSAGRDELSTASTWLSALRREVQKGKEQAACQTPGPHLKSPPSPRPCGRRGSLTSASCALMAGSRLAAFFLTRNCTAVSPARTAMICLGGVVV